MIKQADISELNEFLSQHPATRNIDAWLADLCGQAIGKRIPRSLCSGLFQQGTAMCAAMQLIDARGNSADPMGYGFSDGDPDAYMVPIEGTLVPVPWRGDAFAQVMCQFRSATDGEPFWYEPRHILSNVVNKFTEMGVTPVVAAELEFYLIDAEMHPDGRPKAVHSPLTRLPEHTGKVMSLDKMDEYAGVLDAIESCCAVQGIPATTMISEYGAGQFEINLQHQQDALKAADHAAMLRRAIVGTARSFGMNATFMSKPFAGQSGSGLHIHMSLLDEEGRNIFAGNRPDGDENLQHAIGGMQSMMAESIAIFAPNFNAYRRFKADEFTPVTRDWGDNNRSMAFRVPISNAANRRIEHRVAGADANPYLVIAAVLAGAYHGLENDLEPTEKAHGNAGSSVDEELPLTPWAALQAMRNAELLPRFLGESYPRMYAEVKQAEFQDFVEEVFLREYEWYL